MSLPATDLGILAEHLETHEGMIAKMKLYESQVTNAALKHAIHTHLSVLRNHVNVMLAFMDPSQKGPTHLHKLGEIQLEKPNVAISKEDKRVLTEMKATSKLMASNNFNSALMMKDPHVKHAHIEMSLENVRLQSMYEEILKHVNGHFTPRVTEEMQAMTLREFQHVSEL